MVLLQHRLNVKLSQRQILTPGLVQMVSVLALNKLELKDMINAEMVENPVLEELDGAVLCSTTSAARKKSATASLPRPLPKKIPSRQLRRKILSRRSISAPTSRNISIPAFATRAR